MRVFYESVNGIDTLEYDRVVKIYPNLGSFGTFDYLHILNDQNLVIEKVDTTKWFMSEISDVEFGNALDGNVEKEEE